MRQVIETGDENTDVSDFCDDGTVCMHGSKCIKLEGGFSRKGGREYRCDCTLITKGKYTGYQCDHEATDYCITGDPMDASAVSFCANGQCLEKWEPIADEKRTHKGCECDDGFEGDFCEYRDGYAPIAPNQCYDGTQCKHGSTCVRVDEDYDYPTSRQFRCDCSKVKGVEFYAGFECEYDATHYCILNDAANAGGVSFCTNGDCKETWSPQSNQVAYHKGCDCNLGYDGDYCEYNFGEAPVKKETAGDGTGKEEGKGKNDESSKPGKDSSIFFGVAVPIVIIVGIFLLVRRKREIKKWEQKTTTHSVAPGQEDMEVI